MNFASENFNFSRVLSSQKRVGKSWVNQVTKLKIKIVELKLLKTQVFSYVRFEFVWTWCTL